MYQNNAPPLFCYYLRHTSNDLGNFLIRNVTEKLSNQTIVCFSHIVCLFIRSLQAGSSLYSSTETFISVQCANPGRGGELVGVCGVCARCVGWRKEQ